MTQFRRPMSQDPSHEDYRPRYKGGWPHTGGLPRASHPLSLCKCVRRCAVVKAKVIHIFTRIHREWPRALCAPSRNTDAVRLANCQQRRVAVREERRSSGAQCGAARLKYNHYATKVCWRADRTASRCCSVVRCIAGRGAACSDRDVHSASFDSRPVKGESRPGSPHHGKPHRLNLARAGTVRACRLADRCRRLVDLPSCRPVLRCADVIAIGRF